MAITFWSLFAAVGDLVRLIPFVGDFAGPIFWISFAIYLWKKGYGFLNPRRLAVGGIDMVIKMIPAIQEVPVELLLGAGVVIAMIKFVDKTGVKLPTSGAATTRPHLNTNGVRMPTPPVRNSHITPAPPLNDGMVRRAGQ